MQLKKVLRWITHPSVTYYQWLDSRIFVEFSMFSKSFTKNHLCDRQIFTQTRNYIAKRTFNVSWQVPVNFGIDAGCEFRENWRSENHALQKCENKLLSDIPQIYFAISTKIGRKHLQIVLLISGKWRGQHGTFVTGVNAVTFTRVPWNRQ